MILNIYFILVAVVIAFFVCYAPLYLQRLLLAIITLCSNLNVEISSLSNFMAYLYVISGITFYFGSVINPILYNVISNKYRRAFIDLFRCRSLHKKRVNKSHQKQFHVTRPQNQSVAYYIQQHGFLKRKSIPRNF